MALISQAIDSIITNTAAVIEGTGSYTGVPGVYSNDELLKGGSPSNLSITATGATAKNTIAYSSGVYASDRWISTRAPSFWLLCYSATNAENVDAARKISAWAQASTAFTTANFPANLASGDKFYVLEGFRHVVDGGGEDERADRRFTVDVEPGDQMDIHGSGYSEIAGRLIVRLSLAGTGRYVSMRKAGLANGEILRHAVARRAHWESTYTQAIFTEGSSVEVEIDEDTQNITVTIEWPIHYRLSVAFE